MDLEQLLTELAQKFGEATTDDAKAAIVAAVKAKAKPLWQEAFNEGHGVATAQLQPKLTTAEQAKAAAEQSKKEAETELSKLREQQPTTAQLHEDYGKKLQDKDAEIAQLKEQHTTEKRDGRKNTALTLLRAELAAHVHEDYAEVLVQKPNVRERFQFDDGENLRIMQATGNVPYAGDEEAQIKAIAEELVKDVNPLFKRTDVQGGSGRGSAAGDGGGGVLKGKKLFEKIREEAKATAGAGGAHPQEELHKRLGHSQPAGV